MIEAGPNVLRAFAIEYKKLPPARGSGRKCRFIHAQDSGLFPAQAGEPQKAVVLRVDVEECAVINREIFRLRRALHFETQYGIRAVAESVDQQFGEFPWPLDAVEFQAQPRQCVTLDFL